MKLYNTPDENFEEDILRRAFDHSVVKNIDADKRQVEFIISTESEDRYRDKVSVKGWDLKNYKNNPVVLFGHMGNIPPVGKAVKIWKDTQALRAVAEFMPRDISPFAHSIFRMYEEGYLRAVSVGFRALKYELIKDEDDEWCGGVHFLKQELLEFSAVPVPANPDALIAARQKGIDTMPFKSWAEQMLDDWGKTADPLKSLYGVDRKGMETIRRRAAGAGASIQVPPDVQDDLMKRNLESIRKAKAAKNKSTQLEEVNVGGISYELPVISQKEVGELTIEQKTASDGEKTFTSKGAEDTVAFNLESMEDGTFDDFMKAGLEKGADGNDALVLKFSFDNADISYEIIGMQDENLIGVKTFESLKSTEEEDEEEDEDKSASEDDEDEDDKKAADDESDEDEDSDDESEDADKSTDDEDEEDKSSDDDGDESDDDDTDDEDDDGKDAPEAQTKGDSGDKPAEGTKAGSDEDDEPMTLELALSCLEHNMLTLEDLLDEGAAEKASRHTSRKKVFMAQCLRELANRLDGGKSVPVNSSKGTVKVLEEEDQGMSPEEELEYKKELLKTAQPVLEDMIRTIVEKKKGRLD